MPNLVFDFWEIGVFLYLWCGLGSIFRWGSAWMLTGLISGGMVGGLNLRRGRALGIAG